MEKEGHVMVSWQLVAVFAHGSPTLGNILVKIRRDVSWDGPEALDSIVDCNLKDKIKYIEFLHILRNSPCPRAL